MQPKIYGITEDADFNSLPKRLLPKTKLILQQDLVLKQRILPSLRCNIGW